MSLTASAATRPSIKDHYVFYFVIDGGSGHRIGAMLKKDESTQVAPLQNIRRFFFDRAKGITTTQAVTVWPSSSLPGHLANMTGAFPAKNNIGGQRGFVRDRGDMGRNPMADKRPFFFRSYIGPEFSWLNDRDLSTRVKTMIEYFKDEACGENVSEQTYRGATTPRAPLPLDKASTDAAIRVANQNFSPSAKQTCHVFTINYSEVDHHAHRHVTRKGEAKLESGEAKIEDYLLRVDAEIGRFISSLPPKVFAKSVFVLSADHGMGPGLKHFDMPAAMGESGLVRYKSNEFGKAEALQVIKALTKAIPAVTPWVQGFYANFAEGLKVEFEMGVNSEGQLRWVPQAKYEAAQTIAVWGGNSDGLVYLQGFDRDGATASGRSWSKPVSHYDIVNYPKPDGKSLDVPAYLLNRTQDGAHPVAFTFYPGKAVGTYVIRAREGRASFSVESGNASNPTYCYKVETGKDPLGYLSDISYIPTKLDPAMAIPGVPLAKAIRPEARQAIKDAKGCLSASRWLELTADAWYPNALDRIHGVFGVRAKLAASGGKGWHEGGAMSPDIGVNPIPGWDFLGKDLGEVGHLEGTHGALDYNQSIVPVLIASPDPAIQKLLLTDDGKPATVKVARTVDIVPTLLDLFGKKIDPSMVDGRSLLPSSQK